MKPNELVNQLTEEQFESCTKFVKCCQHRRKLFSEIVEPLIHTLDELPSKVPYLTKENRLLIRELIEKLLNKPFSPLKP